MRVIVIACIAVLLTSRAFADYRGTELLELCKTDKSFIKGFLAGVIDKAEDDRYYVDKSLLARVHDQDDLKFANDSKRALMIVIRNQCIPDSVSIGEIADKFCDYLKANPAQLKNRGAHLANFGLPTIWPCQ